MSTIYHIEQVSVDLKMRLVFSTPGKPQGRGRIERFFRTVNQMFLCELDSYVKRKRQKPNLTLERFEELFKEFLLETYRRISEEGRPTPSARWEGGFLPRMPDSLEQLDLLLTQEVRARKVHLVGNQSSAPYNHALYLRQRAAMMQHWGDFLEQTQRSGKAIEFTRHGHVELSSPAKR